ncbi:hypothetical protein N0B44_33970, partial [Roseibacterium beibuensis]
MLCRATHPLRPRQTRLASRQRLSAAGEGVFTDSAKDPQVVFSDFCRKTAFCPKNMRTTPFRADIWQAEKRRKGQ